MKNLKYIYPSISDPRQFPVAPLFLVRNPRGISQENHLPEIFNLFKT